MNKNIFEIVEEVLKTNSKYISDDGKLLKALVYSDVMTMDQKLLSLLLSNKKIKERFFKDVNGTLVFDKQGFAWFIESKEFLPDSYTRYTNKIGLTNNGDFISKSNDVVLDFPYKDCVLEGGQDKEDQKRSEIFYNETIASDEITRMLAPKVFTNAKRYTKDGVEENITFDENDNLIIKGNNLIVLSSLLKRYEGKVKCIYIDPPYNTGSDSFNYNDSFNHSSWLAFMKNRLNYSKKMLREDGTIFVQCDDNEQAYLKVLMDEIFTKENFVNCIVVKMNESKGLKNAHIETKFPKNKEYLLVYKKSNSFLLNPINIKKDGEEIEKYLTYYKKYIPNKSQHYNDWIIKSFELNDKFEHADKLIYLVKPDNDVKIKLEINKFGMVTNRKGKNIYYYNNGEEIKKVLFLNENLSKNLGDLWTHISTININKESEVATLSNGQKPESLIETIICSATQKNDIVLDYHVGSGTTCAVAHKMGCRYIGVEQMDYIQELSVERLKKVINGSERGISKSVNWKGGGSFVYCELLENANTLIEKIQAASEETISKIKNEIYADERIIPYITRDELNKADVEFNKLDLEEKKKALISLVDKNKLYVNYSDINDENYNISNSDKAFTKSFYAED